MNPELTYTAYVKVWDSPALRTYKIWHLSFTDKDKRDSFLSKIEDSVIYEK